MASSSPMVHSVEAQKFEGRVIVRRFTDQLVGTNELEKLTKAAQDEKEREEKLEEEKRLRRLFDDSADNQPSPKDFDVAHIARAELQSLIDQFVKDAKLKPSFRQQLGFTGKSSRAKAVDMLEDSLQNDFSGLQTSIDNLETKWKQDHGAAYRGFKKLTETLHAHKNAFALFPSQNTYASVLCGGLSCVVKAAKNHSDIAEVLSKYTAEISDKVASCARWLHIIRTQSVRQRLAKIYARMFQFYKEVIAWYLQSKLTRTLQSFNEHLKLKFDDASKDIETAVTEFYREVSFSNTAMMAMACGELSQIKSELRQQRRNYEARDTAAGHRMVVMLEASFVDNQFYRLAGPADNNKLTVEPQSLIEDVTDGGVTRKQARDYAPALEPFINGDEGPALFTSGYTWRAEEEVVPKLRSWLTEEHTSSTLWVSGRAEAVGTATSARATAMAVLAAAWQAESPVLSYFCKRAQSHEVRIGMSVEQVGLLGLVYSLIHQLLEFSGEEDTLDIGETELAALDGGVGSWKASLEVLKALLDCTPVILFCVIDGLNILEWGAGTEWCEQFLDVLKARQRQNGNLFSLLFTTSGQSRVLPSYVTLEERHLLKKDARNLSRSGRVIGVHPTGRS